MKARIYIMIGTGLLVLAMLVVFALLFNRPQTQTGVTVITSQPVQQMQSDTRAGTADPVGEIATPEVTSEAATASLVPPETGEVTPANAEMSAADNTTQQTGAEMDIPATPTSLSRVNQSITLEHEATQTPTD